MFDRRVPLFKLFGFKVTIDLTWIFLAALVTWTLAEGFFPRHYEDFQTSTYWIMGALGAVGLFLSIVFHEFFHSIVARQFGLPMKGITLFIFGGISEMNEEPQSPKAEFYMAIAGPISSVVLGGIFYGFYASGRAVNWPEPVNAVLVYLTGLNFLLAIFNMVPAFPLDGGRVLRSILWGIKGNLRWATRIASRFGQGFATVLVVLGVLSLFGGAFIGGLWFILIGMFLWGASKMSYQQLIIRNALAGEPVRRFMNSDPITVEPSATIEELIENYFYPHHHKMFPVTENGKLAGMVESKNVRQYNKEQWSQHQVGEIMHRPSDENTVRPDTDAVEVMQLMNRTKKSRLLVVEGDKLAGIITLKDLLGFLSLKLDLEDEENIQVPMQQS